jgi:membrane-associated protease RseP (regulator of RpoE activity)
MIWRLIAVVLAAATVYCVHRVGVLHAAMFQIATDQPESAWMGLWYTVPLIGIVLAHEYGHVLAARENGVRTTGPFFIPWPLAFGAVPFVPVLGTLGAFVRLRSPIPSAVAQWDIASAGLLFGAVASGICVAAGSAMSVTVEPQLMSRLWEPAIIRMVTTPETAWHPILTAGWVGCCLTAINLVTVWPLDGWRMLCVLPEAWAERRWSVAAVLLVGFGCLA